jgi:hypothetical protein
MTATTPTLSAEQVTALADALRTVEGAAMTTLRRTDPRFQLTIEEVEHEEPGTVHEAIAELITDLFRVYAIVGELGITPVYPEWED